MYLDDADEIGAADQGDDDDDGIDDEYEDDDEDADGEYDDKYDAGGGGLGSAGQSFHRLGFDADDVGTIHPYGPNMDATKLLNTLTHMDAGVSADTSESDDTDFNPDLKHKLFSTIARTSDGGSSGAGGVKPGPPRDLVAQIVNPRFVTLRWLEPVAHPDEVTSYTVYYRMTTSER